MKVIKFGGSSMASAEQVKKVCDIVLSDRARKVVVVSAPGKRNDVDTKVTDLLINLSNRVVYKEGYEPELQLIFERFKSIIEGLSLEGSFLDEICEDIRVRATSFDGNKFKLIDLLKAAGEDTSAKIVAKYLQKIGQNAVYMNPKDAGLFLSCEFGNARVLSESIENLNKLKNLNEIVIFPGFFGYSKDGDVVTFPRGGSDITGAILAAALDVELYENFTDVDSVFSANPRLINNPAPIEEISYREMRELSYAGFSVLHEETLEPVYKKGIPVNIKNTNNPSAKGTYIVSRRKEIDRPVVGIASDKGFLSIYLSKYMMNREVGFGRRLLQILEDEKIPFEHVPSGIDNVSVVIKEKYLSVENEERILNRIKTELEVEEVEIERGLSLVMVVGEGMSHTIGMAARATKALSESNVNIEMINQGSSEVSMMFAVKEEDTDDSVRALYNEYFS